MRTNINRFPSSQGNSSLLTRPMGKSAAALPPLQTAKQVLVKAPQNRRYQSTNIFLKLMAMKKHSSQPAAGFIICPLSQIYLVSLKKIYSHYKFHIKMGFLLNKQARFISDSKHFHFPYFNLFYFKCLQVTPVFTEPAVTWHSQPQAGPGKTHG